MWFTWINNLDFVKKDAFAEGPGRAVWTFTTPEGEEACWSGPVDETEKRKAEYEALGFTNFKTVFVSS